jgi:peptide/nickel transport system ATP-binding protein
VQIVGAQVVEAIRLHERTSEGAARARTVELFARVGIPDAAARFDAYPHQLSGGLKQRVMIAMALALEPQVLIADEPTTALDVTVQAQIMDLLAELGRDANLALLLITHDLGVVADVADRIAVMYAGRIVEQADVHTLYDAPAHPYTKGLLASIPRVDQRGGTLATIPGLPPNLLRIPPGCPFHPRCPSAQPICVDQLPPAVTLEGGRMSLCHFAHEVVGDRG